MADYGHAAGGITLSQAHTSDDDTSDQSPPPSKPSTVIRKTKNSHHHHQMMIESSTPENAPRKPRGRPPGSKNKPKPPVVITRDGDSAMKPVILEVSAGADIIDNIISFARRNHVGISLISSSGSVSHVTLRQPNSHAHSLSLHGPFHLLSLTGSYFESPSSSSASPPSPCSSFGVTLAGAQGQVFGGIVAGKVTAASQVVVVAATFLNPPIHSLPLSNEGDNHHHHDHHHEVDQHQQQETKPNTAGTAGAPTTTESCSSVCKSMPVYAVSNNPTPVSCQIPPDHHVIHWAPASRSPY